MYNPKLFKYAIPAMAALMTVGAPTLSRAQYRDIQVTVPPHIDARGNVWSEHHPLAMQYVGRASIWHDSRG